MGCADQVAAVDVNPLAVEATRANAERNDVQNCVSAFQSDLFEQVEGDSEDIASRTWCSGD